MPTSVEYLTTAKAGYLAALAADSANPKPDYSIDGQTVSRAQWREGLLRQTKELNTLIQMEDPYELRGQTI